MIKVEQVKLVVIGRKRSQRKRQSAILDYTSTFLSTGLIQGIGVVTGVLTARLLGPAGKGDLATVFWLPGLMTAAGIVALPQAVAFEVSRHPEHDEVLTAAGFWLGLSLGMIEAAILYPLIPYILGPNKQYLVSISRWFLLYLPIAFPGLTLLGIDQGRQAFGRYNLLRLLPAVFYIAGILLLWWLRKANVITIVLSNLLAQFVTSWIRASIAGKKLLPHSASLWVEAGKRVLKRGVMLHLPAFASIVLMRADMPILIHMVSAEEIGYYSVAMAIAMGQIGIATSLVQVNFPKVASHASSQEAISVLLRQFRVAQPVVLGMALIIALITPWVIRYLFGTAFLPAILPAYILIVALAFWGLNQVLDNGLRAMGYGIPGTIANGAGLGVLLISGPFFVRLCRTTGMAIAVLISQACVMGFLLLHLRRKYAIALKEMFGVNSSSLNAIRRLFLMRKNDETGDRN